MGTKAGILQPAGTDPLERGVPPGCLKGRKPAKADKDGGGRTMYNFLNTVFHPVPLTRLNPLFNRNSYDFLYRSARNYSHLLGSSFDYMPQEKDFTGLFRYFEGLLPEGQHLLLIEQDKKLSFKIRFGDDFLINEVFFIPIEILNRTEGMFRDILLSFFRLFHQMYHFQEKELLYDYEMIVDCYFEEWNDEDREPGVRDFLKAYREGYINDTFSLIYRKPSRKAGELERLIESYTPKNSMEGNLLTSIKQGINIINMGKNIFSYACRPGATDENFYNADEDDSMIEVERMLRLVYSGNDYVSENYLEYINIESEDHPNEYFPRKSLVLTPDTKELLEVDFVECFFTWLSGFIDNLYDYGNK